ncbi:Uma2 family endonuclease [Nonomuraea rhodomycinica]|uniref:Uma2 family endonuclease n=1 Tax=Nonomuraea rhodomycinica TaxID=1712872 RepID=A0A7Y6IL91_9ACTN|nr:Uma2 family endonuclease [Nonomuraea rhodomycinica]NUW40153.1 Uma2 family endonuclease [Nonomuraea rhodomycinica]
MTESEIRDTEWVTAMATTEPTTGSTVLPGVPPFTVDDLLKFPDDGNRYELFNGSLLVSPAPIGMHQRVSHRICRILEDAALPAGVEALPTVNLRISDADLYVPDVAVVSVDRTETYAATYSPEEFLLVVEVVSPSSRAQDRLLKAGVYAAAGIPVYWRVEMDEGPTVYVYELDGKTYGPPMAHKAGTVADLHAPFPVSFDPADLVRRRG